MSPSKKCFLPSVGSTISIFMNFQFIAINIHINFAIFENVLPALGGKHIFGCHRLSKIRKIHANHNHVHFLRFWVTLGASWGRLASILDRLGVNSGQIWAKLGPTWTNMSPSWANLSRLDAALGPTCCQPGPSWVQLGYGKPRKSLFFHWFS